MARVNELLLQEISRVVLERQHPDIGFVTFTGVQVTEDLLEAKVFFSVLGTDEEKSRTAHALHMMKREFLVAMRRLESLKYIPHFHFVYDDTPSRAARLHDIIENIHHEPPLPVVPEPEPEPEPQAPAPEAESAPAPKKTRPAPRAPRQKKK